MNRIISIVKKHHIPIAIICLSVLAYGILIPWLKYYIDDWVVNWVYTTHGTKGMIEYFSTDQPLLGLIYQVTIPFLHGNALFGQLFGLVNRIFCSLTFYWMMVLIWPDRKFLTTSASLLFAIYPGFLLQPLALTMGYTWLVYSIFILSNCFSILSIRVETRKNVFTVLALIFSLLNILLLEYFIPLEIIRFGIILYLNNNTNSNLASKLLKSFKTWLPYFFVLIVATLSRFVFYKYQTVIYPLGLLNLFKENFFVAFWRLLKELITALYQTVLFAWIKPAIEIIDHFSKGKTYLLLLTLIVLVFVCLEIIFHKNLFNKKGKNDLSPLYISILALLVAGIPFYVTLLQVKVVDISSRFTIPFMIGSALFISFLLEIIKSNGIRVVILNLIIATSVGLHILNANEFRVISQNNNQLMYEIFWRAPNLKPNTMIVINEQPDSKFFTRSTITSEFNLIYPHIEGSSFGFLYPRDLLDIYPSITQQNEITNISGIVQDYVGTSQNIIVFQKSENSCLRFIDKDSPFIIGEIEQISLQYLSNPENILGEQNNVSALNSKLIGAEPVHGWCYYFEKTELALQLNDYQAIVDNYEFVKSNKLSPKNEYEWLPFIEGLAKAGSLQPAVDLAQEVIEKNNENDSYHYLICKKLENIKKTDPVSETQKITTDKLNCQQWLKNNNY